MEKTLADYRTLVSAELSLNVDDAAELALIDSLVNDGVEYVIGKTGAKVAIATAALTADEGDYELDTSILRVLWIQSSATGSNSEWEPTSPSEILRLRLNSTPSSPTLRYAVDGANMLMLYPVPATADTLTIRYVPRPAALDDPGDSPSDIPGEFHKLPFFYACWFGGSYDDDQTSAQGARYEQLLDKGITEMSLQINKKRGRRLPRATVSRGNRRSLAHRNDADVF